MLPATFIVIQIEFLQVFVGTCSLCPSPPVRRSSGAQARELVDDLTGIPGAVYLAISSKTLGNRKMSKIYHLTVFPIGLSTLTSKIFWS